MLLKVETHQLTRVQVSMCLYVLSIVRRQHVFFTSCEAACGFPHVVSTSDSSSAVIVFFFMDQMML
ncbi:hypothetical protein LDENG_00121500 [Lucifuga dentata]|nr:hypothetical protein LDENG_00121500 [Lucifuga dentata]